MNMDDRSYLFDAAGELCGQRQREIDGIVSRLMADPEELTHVIGGDCPEVLSEVVAKLMQTRQDREDVREWLSRCYHEALEVLYRRANSYAENSLG